MSNESKHSDPYPKIPREGGYDGGHREKKGCFGYVIAIPAAVVLVVLALILAGCGSSHSSAPDPGGTPGTRARVIQEPYGFRNVAFSCFGTTGVYVTSRSATADLASSVAVLANDPACA